MIDLSSFPLGDYSRDFYDKYLHKHKIAPSAPLIHVVGSNGKTITATMLSRIYAAAGYQVGLFLSLAPQGIHGMIQVNNAPADKKELERLFKENEKDFHKFGLTRFEASVALAYLFFQTKKLDLIVVEAGMGGAVDATNVDGLNTKLVVLTSCSLEHTSYLGTTVSQIAVQKALVLREGSKFVIPLLDDETKGVLLDLAKEYDAQVYQVESFHFPHLDAQGFHFDYCLLPPTI